MNPVCRICGYSASPWLGDHLTEVHSLSLEDYARAYPGAPTITEELLSAWKGRRKSVKRQPPAFTPQNPPKVEILGYKVPVNLDVEEDSCLPLPPEYRFPEHGDLSLDMVEAMTALLRGRHTYIFGLPGSGKDAFFHAVSWLTRRPAIIKTVNPTTDIEAWLFTRSFDKEGTKWETGELFHALTEGYTTTSGRKLPYLILITDFDRATKSQAEFLRLIIDSISGRVQGPMGKVYNLFPGTQIVVTANTSGGGDSRGRMVSANVIDASILDRFERKLEFHWMEWLDEEPIVRAKFPLLAQRCPEVFAQVGKATTILRQSIREEKLYAEFSHRAVCAWLGHCEDIIVLTGSVPDKMLRRGFRVWADGLPDETSRDEAHRLIDPVIRGGAI